MTTTGDEHSPVKTTSDVLEVRADSSQQWALGRWDGICLTPGWLRDVAGPTQQAILALSSLSSPLWLAAADREAIVDDSLPLASLCQPLILRPGLTPYDEARIVERMQDCRHSLMWFSTLDADNPLHRVYGQLAEVPSRPMTGLIEHSALQFRAASEVKWAQSERSVLSCLTLEARWENGCPAYLPSGSSEILDAILRASLRDTDVVGRLDDHVYLALLPGQTCDEALVPARRLLTVDCAQVLPPGWPALTLAVGLAGRDAIPTDGLNVVREADIALRMSRGDGQPTIYRSEEAVCLHTVTAPRDDVVLRPRARLIDATPGLFRCPFTDRQFERVLRLLCEVLPDFDIERGQRLAAYADTLSILIGGMDLHARRILWRACLLHNLGAVLKTPDSPNEGEGLGLSMVPFRRIMDASPLLGMECTALIDAHRLLCGAGGSRIRPGSPLYLVARILEVADAYERLRAESEQGEAPSGAAQKVRANLLAGAGLRYDREVVDAMVQWLDVQESGMREH